MLSSDIHLKQIKKALEDARFDETSLLSEVQPVYMGANSQEDLCLMQLNPELLKEVIEGETLTIRGEPNESAVLCTKFKTYDIKKAETSNSLLTLPTLHFFEDTGKDDSITENSIIPQEVSGVFHTYYEVKPCKAKLKKLRSFLDKDPFRGKVYEDDTMKKYTFDELLCYIQASEEEIRSALCQMHACEIDGFIRILDFDFKFEVFSSIRNVMESESFSIDKIPKKIVMKLLECLFPSQVLDNVFNWYASDTGVCDEKGNSLFALKEKEVCQLHAEVLLRPALRFNLRDFHESWQISVPEGMTAHSSYLKGIALSDYMAKPQVIFYFPVENLPETINERLKKLFETRPKWTFEDIEPYLKDLSVENQTVKGILTKYTRSSMNDGVLMYSSRW